MYKVSFVIFCVIFCLFVSVSFNKIHFFSSKWIRTTEVEIINFESCICLFIEANKHPNISFERNWEQNYDECDKKKNQHLKLNFNFNCNLIGLFVCLFAWVWIILLLYAIITKWMKSCSLIAIKLIQKFKYWLSFFRKLFDIDLCIQSLEVSSKIDIFIKNTKFSRCIYFSYHKSECLWWICFLHTFVWNFNANLNVGIFIRILCCEKSENVKWFFLVIWLLEWGKLRFKCDIFRSMMTFNVSSNSKRHYDLRMNFAGTFFFLSEWQMRIYLRLINFVVTIQRDWIW